MTFNDKIRKLCRICGDVGSIHIFGSMGQSLDLSEKINTLLPIHVCIYNFDVLRNNYNLTRYNYHYIFNLWTVDNS